jgi:hypothetical protein
MAPRIIGPSDEPERRVVRKVRHEKEYGYAETSSVTYQILQEKTPVFFGLFSVWREIDREVVPEDVMISLGVYGDTNGWVSRFGKYIPRPA